MRKKAAPIPVNRFDDRQGPGIVIERLVAEDLLLFEEATHAHRHDFHAFFLLEQGTVSIEIDFQKHRIKAPSIVYMHPDQVHVIKAFKDMVVSSCTISAENLNAEYLGLLESITPAKPLRLKKEAFSILSETVSLCLKFSARKNVQLHRALLKDSCNALAALVISLYMEQPGAKQQLSRPELITKTFRELLERNFTKMKSPAEFASTLALSTNYLNECVKSTTGFSVSHHIHQRIVLEAKRMLYHSGQSVKEIAAALGYEDAAYFSRLFTKTAGLSALAFRGKNRE